nr:TPA_asm: L1 [Manis javanica papillomavirus 1]DAZ92278.1 TPA_asm: L1 [Manis javanica papillomavirus 1]
MAVWLPSQNKFYIPPQPFTKILSTDEYVTRTQYYYHAGSERLLTVGHPYYEILKDETVTVPKVSPNQYRVFRVRLPDPNKFAFADKNIYDPEKERLVWACRGLEVSRGQPLGVPVTGSPLFNRGDDAENSGRYTSTYKDEADHRQNIAFDPKQVQVLLVGCEPATGEYWAAAKRCSGVAYDPGDAPPIELKHRIIQDGDMMDIGFGAVDFRSLQPNKADAPLDIVNAISIYPDYIKMAKEKYGNSLFFYARREQLYGRHFFTRDGDMGKESTPDALYIKSFNGQAQSTLSTSNYMVTPSGSLISSDSQLFNRPYWVQRAQGKNNGIAWHNQLFVTVADNTRGTIITVNTTADGQAVSEYKASKFKEYLRHVEEYELEFIMQLCKVRLTPENLAFLHTMDEALFDEWELNVTAPRGVSIEDTYRYISSLATKCPDAVAPPVSLDPWSQYKFWDVDLREQMSEELDMFPLGRKFLYQSGLGNGSRSTTISSTAPAKRSTKRKRG